MRSKWVRGLLRAAWGLELVVAVVILAVTLVQLFLVGQTTLNELLAGQFDLDGFFVSAMTIVVGIEFVKMLLLHTPGQKNTAGRPACGIFLPWVKDSRPLSRIVGESAFKPARERMWCACPPR